MEYNRQELDNKNTPQLKDILKNMKLKVSGRKEELIERILTNQPKETIQPISGDYLSLLPKDITNIVQRYRIESNSNNVMIKNLLDDEEVRWRLTRGIGILKVKQELEKLGIPIKIVFEDEEDYSTIKEIEYSEMPLISDRIASNFLYFLIQKGMPEELLNTKLKKYNANYRIIIFKKLGYKNATDFEIMKVKYIE